MNARNRRAARLVVTLILGLHLVAANCVVADDDHSVPELARDLPKTTYEEGDLTFKQRVHDRFPIGTPEHDVVDTLTKQGFSIWTNGKTASFDVPGLVCRTIWRVFWTTDAVQRIVHIDGLYAGQCL